MKIRFILVFVCCFVWNVVVKCLDDYYVVVFVLRYVNSFSLKKV